MSLSFMCTTHCVDSLIIIGFVVVAPTERPMSPHPALLTTSLRHVGTTVCYGNRAPPSTRAPVIAWIRLHPLVQGINWATWTTAGGDTISTQVFKAGVVKVSITIAKSAPTCNHHPKLPPLATKPTKFFCFRLYHTMMGSDEEDMLMILI